MGKYMEIRPMPKPTDSIPVAILADGGYPSGETAVRTLAAAEKVVCCDGAAMEFVSRGGTPYAIVGDCDSLSPEFREEYAGIIRSDSDQETNDLTKAVRFCLSEGLHDITILGATGKREDHTLGNISLLADYYWYEGTGTIRMITDHGVFEPHGGEVSFESYAGQQVSLFLPDTSSRITTINLKYPLTNARLTNWWQGTLNESPGGTFGIVTDGTAIVFRAFGK